MKIKFTEIKYLSAMLERISIVLADDDIDDCNFFKEALDEFHIPTKLATVYDGEQLIQFLTQESDSLPHVLFLDLNMPRKNGFDCLVEIKSDDRLKTLPVIIYSTSFEKEIANLLYENGAHYYVRKPAQFSQLRQVIHHALTLIEDNNFDHPSKDRFVISL